MVKLEQFYYISGFSEGESTFTVKISNNKKLKAGWRVQPSFAIELHAKDKTLLDSIESFFCTGTVIPKKRNDTPIYSVQSLKELTNVIIPHFYKYPLITQKRADFKLFKMVVKLMNQKKHLSIEGLHEILSIRASINKGLSDALTKCFSSASNIIPVTRPLVETLVNIDPNWLAGFTNAEGCLFVWITKSNTHTGSQILLKFSISQHSCDSELMAQIANILGCGRLEKHPKRSSVEFVVTKFSDIDEKVIPFFDKYSLQGSKILDFEDFLKVAELMRDKAHLTASGLDQIRKIKSPLREEWTVKELVASIFQSSVLWFILTQHSPPPPTAPTGTSGGGRHHATWVLPPTRTKKKPSGGGGGGGIGN